MYIHMYMSTCLHIRAHAYQYTSTFLHTYVYTYMIYMCTYTCVSIHIFPLLESICRWDRETDRHRRRHRHRHKRKRRHRHQPPGIFSRLYPCEDARFYTRLDRPIWRQTPPTKTAESELSWFELSRHSAWYSSFFWGGGGNVVSLCGCVWVCLCVFACGVNMTCLLYSVFMFVCGVDTSLPAPQPPVYVWVWCHHVFFFLAGRNVVSMCEWTRQCVSVTVCVLLCVCMRVWMNACACSYIHMCIYSHMCVYIYIFINVRICTSFVIT